MPEPLTGGLAQWRVLPVRKKMFNFAAQVARPKQSLARHCRQAAVTLAASWRTVRVDNEELRLKVKKSIT